MSPSTSLHIFKGIRVDADDLYNEHNIEKEDDGVSKMKEMNFKLNTTILSLKKLETEITENLENGNDLKKHLRLQKDQQTLKKDIDTLIKQVEELKEDCTLSLPFLKPGIFTKELLNHDRYSKVLKTCLESNYKLVLPDPIPTFANDYEKLKYFADFYQKELEKYETSKKNDSMQEILKNAKSFIENEFKRLPDEDYDSFTGRIDDLEDVIEETNNYDCMDIRINDKYFKKINILGREFSYFTCDGSVYFPTEIVDGYVSAYVDYDTIYKSAEKSKMNDEIKTVLDLMDIPYEKVKEESCDC